MTYRGLFHGAFYDNKDTPVTIPIPDAQTQARFDEQRDFSKWLDGCLNGIAEQREAGELETAIDKLMADELGAIFARTDNETRQRFLDHLRGFVAFAKRSGVSASLPVPGPIGAAWIFHEWVADRDIAKAQERARALRFLNETDAYLDAVIRVCKNFGPRGGGGGGIPVTSAPRINDNSGPVALAARPS